MTDNHFGWKHPGHQLARGLINIAPSVPPVELDQMYIVRVKQARLEFQYTQGQFKAPMTFIQSKNLLAAAHCFWTKTCKLIWWYPGWELGVIPKEVKSPYIDTLGKCTEDLEPSSV